MADIKTGAVARRCQTMPWHRWAENWHRSAQGEFSGVFPENFIKVWLVPPFLPANSACGSRSQCTTESETSSLLETVGWFLTFYVAAAACITLAHANLA